MTTHDPSLRATSNLLCLWGLCANAACRRARACKSDPNECLTRYARLAPEEARFGALATLQGERDGAGIEEVRHYEPAALAALESWIALVQAANGNKLSGDNPTGAPQARGA